MADAEMPRFHDNFKKLKDGEAIPADVEAMHLSATVRQAIGDLEDPTIKVLIDLAKNTGSHLFLHEKHGTTGKIIAMGL